LFDIRYSFPVTRLTRCPAQTLLFYLIGCRKRL
jgi:hypothetical protein